MWDSGGSGRVEHVRGAVHVDVVHPVLVADRVEDEGEVHERIRALLGDQGGNAAITDAHVHEAGARSGHGRGADVEVHDLVFLVLDQQIGEAAADVAGPTRDQVLHRSLPLSRTGAKPTSNGVRHRNPWPSLLLKHQWRAAARLKETGRSPIQVEEEPTGRCAVCGRRWHVLSEHGPGPQYLRGPDPCRDQGTNRPCTAHRVLRVVETTPSGPPSFTRTWPSCQIVRMVSL